MSGYGDVGDPLLSLVVPIKIRSLIIGNWCCTLSTLGRCIELLMPSDPLLELAILHALVVRSIAMETRSPVPKRLEYDHLLVMHVTQEHGATYLYGS